MADAELFSLDLDNLDRAGHRFAEIDVDKEDQVAEYMRLLDLAKTHPDTYTIVYDEYHDYTATGLKYLIRHICWWQGKVNGSGH
jgi:hypothetical protein